MSVNLQAVARLNAAPYMASLKKIGAATASMSKSNMAASKAEANQTVRDQNRKIAAAQPFVAATRAQASAHKEVAQSARQSLAAQRYLYGDLSRIAARTALGFAAVPVAAAAAGIAWEKNFAEVVRTSDPIIAQSESSVNKLRSSLVNMVQSMPASWADVTEIATLANQMGIASRETIAFTRAVAMFSSTSDVTVEAAATAFGRLKAIVPDIGSDFMGLADSILKVGVNSVATEGEIINIVTQISSIAGAAKMSDKEMIGLAGAMASVRVPPELSRGVTTRVFGQISRAVADGGGALEGFAKISGMSAQEFANSWGVNGKTGDAFQSFMKGIRQLGPRAEAELRGLGITSVRDVPVVLRLANAADSEGNFGGLLKQTIDDAENAAGETQRQYEIASATIAAKLKMTGNNLMAFFDGISQSAMGPLGTALDFINDKLKDITNSLDEPHKLFGRFEMPFTNAELIGSLTALSGIAAAFLAIGSAGLKIAEIGTAMRGFFGIFRGNKGTGIAAAAQADARALSTVGQRYVAFPAQVQSGMTKAASAAQRGYARMATYHTRMTKSLTPGDKGQMVFAQAGNRRDIQSTAQVYNRHLSAIQGRAAATSAAVGASFASMGNAARATGRGIGAAASFAFGPWGLLIGIAAGALGMFVENSRAASTEASDLANELSRATDAADRMSAIKDITIGGLFGQESKPFENGIKNLQDVQKEMDALYKTRMEASKKYDPMGEGTMGVLAAQAGSEKKASQELSEAYRTVNKAYSEMANAGNMDMAIQGIVDATSSFSEFKNMVNAPEMKDFNRDLQAAFDAVDISMTDANLQKFYSGTLPAVRNELMGIGEAAMITNAQIEAMGGEEAFSKMVSQAQEVAAGFIDAAAAIEEFGNTGLQGFIDTLGEQMAAQEAWGQNLAKAGQIGGSQFVEALLQMGPEVAPVLDEIVADFEATGGDASGQWKTAMDSIMASTNDMAGQAGVAAAAARDSMLSVLGDTDLTDALAKVLSPDDFTTVSAAMGQMGTVAATAMAEGILASDDIESAIEAAVNLSNRIKAPAIKFDAELSPYAIPRINQMLSGFAESQDLKIPAGVDLNTDTTIGELRNFMGDENFMVELDADLNLAEAYAASDAFRAYMLQNGVDMELGANPSMAFLTVSAVQGIIEGTVSEMVLDALTAPAEGKLWSFVELADGSQAAVQVDAKTGAADLKTAQFITETNGRVSFAPVDANTDRGRNAVAALKAHTDSTGAAINVYANDYASAQINAIAQTRTAYINVVATGVEAVANAISSAATAGSANGNIFEAYANGGVREDHRPQILPAGVNRLWAEPETGGEAYIPFANSKRKRATGILETVADRFGYQLVSNTAKYANGGQYDAQALARSVRTASSGSGSMGLSTSDKQFFAHIMREVIVTADGQAITGLSNRVNDKNGRFGR